MANSVDNFPHPRHNWEIEYPQHQSFLLESNLGSNPRKNGGSVAGSEWLMFGIQIAAFSSITVEIPTQIPVFSRREKDGERWGGTGWRFDRKVSCYSIQCYFIRCDLRAIRATISNNNPKENNKSANQRGDPEPLCDRLTKEEGNHPSYV